VLLPHHLDRFQLDPSGLKRNLNVEEQRLRLLDRCQKPASGNCNRATDSEPVRGAAKPAHQYEEQATPRHEPSSFATVPTLADCASATHAKGQGGDELDRIVAEVQEMADLVLLLANYRLSTMANKIYSPSIPKMKVMSH
jgi:hypothetical protein